MLRSLRLADVTGVWGSWGPRGPSLPSEARGPRRGGCAVVNGYLEVSFIPVTDNPVTLLVVTVCTHI